MAFLAMVWIMFWGGGGGWICVLLYIRKGIAGCRVNCLLLLLDDV